MSYEEEFPFVWGMIYYPLVVTMFFINCFADVEPSLIPWEKSQVGLHSNSFLLVLKYLIDYMFNIQKPSPEAGASMVSVLTYFWFRPLIWTGYKNPLETKDLWDLDENDKSRSVVPKYDRNWEKALQNAAK